MTQGRVRQGLNLTSLFARAVDRSVGPDLAKGLGMTNPFARGIFALSACLGLVSLGCSVSVTGDGVGGLGGGLGGSESGSGEGAFPTAPEEPVRAPSYTSHCTPAPALVPHAVCVCGDMSNAGSLTTYGGGGGRGNVGVNGRFSGATGTKIDGSLHVAKGVSFAGSLDVVDSMYTGGRTSGSGSLDVGQSLRVGGDLSGAGDFDVRGELQVAGRRSVAGSLRYASEAVFVPATAAPCTCAKDKIYDVAKAVDLARASNDNAAAGIPTSFEARELRLKSGRYFFTNVRSVGSSRIVAEGNVQVYVDGDLDAVGSSQIRLEAGATLDLFVKGAIRSAGDVSYGDASRPDAFRLYVGGPNARISFAGSRAFHGVVYAPEASLSFAGDTEVTGALLAKEIHYAGDLHVRYAPVTTQTATCEEQPPPPPSCNDRLN